ncbi:MAG: coat protein 2 [Plant associated deltapartitivirus 1]|nr:MAG: coat protein 2 [Plant associated deltapartitivirus 1]
MATPQDAANQFTGLNRDEFQNIATFLEDRDQIGVHSDKALGYARVHTLRLNEIHARLVTLYTVLFKHSWQAFKHITSRNIPADQANNPQRYIANCYITAWIWDLRCTIREATRKVSGKVFNDYFSELTVPIIDRYDPFLQHLNTIIRPTKILQATEEAIHFPHPGTVDSFDPESLNLYGIEGAMSDSNIVKSIVDTMDNPNTTWSTVPLNTNTFGRPGWLFDYRKGEAYAWFPMDSNYSLCDLIAPQILSIPCTERLGMCDPDDWRPTPRNQTIRNPSSLLTQDRIVPRRFYGSAEYRTVEIRVYHFDLSLIIQQMIPITEAQSATPSTNTLQGSGSTSKGKETLYETDTHMTEAAYPPYDMNQYRLIDWCYYARVTTSAKEQTVNKALRNFIQKGAQKASETLEVEM